MRKCGYEVEVLEQRDSPGGLSTSRRRGDYTFETCLHWLIPKERFTAKLTFVNAEEFVRLEHEQGQRLSVFTQC